MRTVKTLFFTLFCDLHALDWAPGREVFGAVHGLECADPDVIGLALCEACDLFGHC